MSINPKGIPLVKIGRDVQGRFRPGNRGGPGNPFARKVAALRKALLDSVGEQDIKDMVEILKQQARQGDKTAIKLILQYCVGKPEPPRDPDRMDIDEWDRLRQMRVGSVEQFREAMESMPACLACHMAELHWPCNLQDGPPFEETIHYIHTHMQAACQPSAELSNPGPITPDSARPDAAPVQPRATANQTRESNTQTEPTAPTRPSSATEKRKPNDRRVPSGPSRRDSHSPTQPPSPNGGNEAEQLRAAELPQRFFQPSGQTEQTERKPPPG